VSLNNRPFIGFGGGDHRRGGKPGRASEKSTNEGPSGGKQKQGEVKAWRLGSLPTGEELGKCKRKNKMPRSKSAIVGVQAKKREFLRIEKHQHREEKDRQGKLGPKTRRDVGYWSALGSGEVTGKRVRKKGNEKTTDKDNGPRPGGSQSKTPERGLEEGGGGGGPERQSRTSWVTTWRDGG